MAYINSQKMHCVKRIDWVTRRDCIVPSKYTRIDQNMIIKIGSKVQQQMGPAWRTLQQAGFEPSSLCIVCTLCVLLLQSSDYKRHKQKRSPFVVQTCIRHHATPSPFPPPLVHQLSVQCCFTIQLQYLPSCINPPYKDSPSGLFLCCRHCSKTTIDLQNYSDELAVSLFYFLICNADVPWTCLRLHTFTKLFRRVVKCR